MKLLSFKSLIFVFLLVLGRNTYACNVAPSLSTSTTHTCGLPYIVKAVNTSTGSQKNTAKYWYKLDNVKVSDTIKGKDSIVLLLKKTGTHGVRLFVKDSSGCIDSSSLTSITVTSNAKTILDQNMNYSLSPTWMNCLQFINDPDSFTVNFKSADTLKNLKIFWGDGSMDTTSGNLMPNTFKSHLFNGLGIFTIKIVTTNGNCIDTVYGTTYNQRQPTAGIVGPTSGSNRGCAPHRLKIVNNSYNISNNTTFLIDWGNGDNTSLPYTGANDTVYHTYKKGVCSGVIKITATNVCGSSFTTWNPIDISEKDKALWTVNTTCNPNSDHVFNNLSSDLYCLTPDIKSYFWDFGDGTTVGWINSKTAQYHKYKTEGDYIVTLIAKSACGNDTFKGKVQVYYNPVAAFTFSSNRGCKPLSVSLTDTSKGRGITRLWTITDGSTVITKTDSILNYSFTNPGNNTIALKVTNKCGSNTLTRTFRVNDKPHAAFANITGTCAPVTVNFTNTSSSYFNNPTYKWILGDSTTSTSANPASKVFNTPGNYTIKLMVSDTCGNDTFEQTFTAYGLPKAKFTSDTTGCTFDSITFVNQSTNSTTNIWSFGDNSTLTNGLNATTKHAYSTTGTFNIRLIAGTGSGCKDTAYGSLNIKPGAKAQFDVNKTYACNPVTFKFTNKSFYGKDYKWYVNGNLRSTAFSANDTTIYTDSTILNVTLIATSSSSCLGDTFSQSVFTPKNPVASIANKDSGCSLVSVNFNNQSTFANAYNWNLGNGTSSTLKNPSATYNAASNRDTVYNVRLLVSNWASCKDSVNTTVKVFPAPTAAFNLNTDKGCGPLQVAFTNLSHANNGKPFNTLSHAWTFGSGSTSNSTDPSNTFSPSNSKDTVHSVKLKVTSINGCVDSTSKSVRVYPKPLVSFTADKTSGCAILPVSFNNQSSPKDTGSINIMTFKWNSGNGSTSTAKNFSASYKASNYSDTVYTVKLIGSSEHACVDSSVVNITVHPQPVAKFTLNKISGCTPLHVSTSNLSVSKDGKALSHAWNFGNNYQSTFKDDSTVFINNSNADLNFTIKYQAISFYGCKDTASTQVTVRPKPVASFNVSTKKACAPLNLKVTDNSTNAAQYYWGQGNNQQLGSATQNFILSGLPLFDSLYVIAHQVASTYGCLSDTVYQQVIVVGRPKADFVFSADSVCAKQSINLINTTLGGYQYVWKFGDNTSSVAVNPKHTFPKMASNGRDTFFNVSLEVKSASNCRDTAYKTIHLVNKPGDKLILDKVLGCTDLTISMTHASKSFKTLYWDFGDNSTLATDDSVKHTFVNLMGNLTMQPKVTLYRQRFNCNDTTSTNVFVYPKPVADFKAQRNDPCDAGNYQFINKSKYNVSNTWVINELNTVSSSSFSAVLPSSNEKDTFYSVKLLIKNTYQCVDSAFQIIKVKPKMHIDFDNSPLIACEKGLVNFTNKSQSAVRYFWSFGDGGLSNEVNPTYVYNHYGNYKVMLFGYDKDGCVDSSDGNTFFKVLEKPKADFTFLPAMPKLPNAIVTFTSTPTINSTNVDNLTYEWNFGDASFPTQNKGVKHPVHTYTTAGNKEVTLTIWNQQCSDVISKPLFVEDPKPEITFSADTTQGCAALTVHFKNNTINAQSYRWVFGDGTPDSYEKEPTHVFKFAGKWDVTLIAIGTGGTSSKTVNYMITVLPRPDADFFTNKRFLNLPNAVFSMQNISNNAIKYNWYIYDSFNNVIDGSTLRDPSFNIQEVGQYSVKLIATNSYGCTDTMLKHNYIGTFKEGYVYVPNAFSPNNNGRNEGFKPSTFNVKTTGYSFKVFTRWGELVYETNDLDAEWDGTFNGEQCTQDVYVFTVNGQYINNDQFTFRGTLTLLR